MYSMLYIMSSEIHIFWGICLMSIDCEDVIFHISPVITDFYANLEMVRSKKIFGRIPIFSYPEYAIAVLFY